MRPEFNPEDYNFYYSNRSNDTYIWYTKVSVSEKTSDYDIIGTYRIEYDMETEFWDIVEIIRKNDKDHNFNLFVGKIPTREFGHNLFVNMEMNLPVIQREVRINKIII